MSFNDNDTNNTNNNINNMNNINNNSFDNNLNYEDSDFSSNEINQYDNSGLGNASYEQPDYGDFGSDYNNESYSNDNGLKKKLIIAIAVIIAIILLILLFSALFGKGNKKLNIDVPNIIYAGSEVEFVTAIPNSDKELFYKFSSDNEEILQFEYKSLASGDTANTMIPKKDGKVKIKVEAFNNGKKVGTYENEVVVCPVFDENIFTSNTYKVGAGDDLSLNIDLGVYDECYQNIKYTSTDEEVATISSEGVVFAKKKGKTTIKVSNSYKTVTKAVEVVSASSVNSVTGIKLNTTSLTITVGANASLSASITPENATNKAITWSSSNESVALVSSKGKVAGVGVGSAVITATTQDGNKTAMANVTVKKASTSSSSSSSSSSTSTTTTIKVTKVNINSDDFTIKVGNTKTLTYTITPSNATNKKVTWDTTDPSVAKVSTAGKVTGVGAGTAYITLKSADGASDKIKVVVTKSDPIKATSITLSPTSLTLNVGAKKTVSATVLPSNATIKTVTWVSQNTNVAKVDSSGNVTAVAAGTTKISCYTTDGSVSSSINITVKSTSSTDTPVTPTNVNVTQLIATPSSVELYVGDTQNVSVTIIPSNATNKNVTWRSSNTNIATVSNGVIKGIKVGTAAVNVVSNSNSSVSQVIAVTVKEKPVEKSVSCSLTFTDANSKTISDTSNIYSTAVNAKAVCIGTNTIVKTMTLTSNTNSLSIQSTTGAETASTTKTGIIKNATGKNNGQHTITVKATDADGKEYSISKQINIKNYEAVKSISCTTTFNDGNQTDFGLISKGSSVKIKSVCTASNTTVANVTLSGATNLINTASLSLTGANTTSATKTGYIYNAETKEGTYTITTTATDADGKTYTSTKNITITYFAAPIFQKNSTSSSNGNLTFTSTFTENGGRPKTVTLYYKNLTKGETKYNTKTMTKSTNYKYTVTVNTISGNKYQWYVDAKNDAGENISSEYTTTAK